MVNGSRKVVLKKPKIDISKQVDLTPTPPEQPKEVERPKSKKKNGTPIKKSEEKPKEIIKEEPELKIDDDNEINIEEENTNKTILRTSSNKIIIAKPKPIIVPERIEKSTSFDDQFLEKLEIKSKINKDSKMLEKLDKSQVKPIRQKPQRSKRRMIIRTIIGLIASLGLTFITFIVINIYVHGGFSESIASFIFAVSCVMLTIMCYVWTIVDFIIKDKTVKKK